MLAHASWVEVRHPRHLRSGSDKFVPEAVESGRSYLVASMRDTLVYLAIVLPLAALSGVLARRRSRSFWIYFVFCALIPIGSLVTIPYLLGGRSVR